jgi:hypothetical protein
MRRLGMLPEMFVAACRRSRHVQISYSPVHLMFCKTSECPTPLQKMSVDGIMVQNIDACSWAPRKGAHLLGLVSLPRCCAATVRAFERFGARS